MRIVQVIESHCKCKIAAVKLYLRSGEKIAYSAYSTENNISSEKFTYGSIKAEVFFISDTDLSKKNKKFMSEMVGCLIESIVPWDLQDNLSRVADIPSGTVSLDEILDQTLNTLICSNLFDKTAIMFYNEKKQELRGVRIAEIPPCPDSMNDNFKMLSVPVMKDTLAALSDENKWPVQMEDSIFNAVENVRLQNHLIVSPLMTGSKIHGVLVTYAEGYAEKHFSASKSTARFISAMLSATLVYKKYQMALSSEQELTEMLQEHEQLFVLGNHTASIAHEIKNPLIAIGGFAKRLMKAINDPNLQKMAKIILTESERLERLTADILSFSNKQVPHKVPVILHDEMDCIRLLFESRSAETEIELCIEIPEDAIIEVDKNQFRQVIVNLIANAMNAIGQKGMVRIKMRETETDYHLSVADNGPGVPEDKLATVFTPFFTTSSNGTGLGLPISKKIMINHGGDIVLCSSPKGAEFTLIIPKQNK